MNKNQTESQDKFLLSNLPKRKPDFSQLMKVLQRQAPDRPTLFEFFLNERLYTRLAGPPLEGRMGVAIQVLHAFTRAGYDYATFLPPNFGFPSERQDFGAHPGTRTVSLNQGGVIHDRASFRAYDWPDPAGMLDLNSLDLLQENLPEGMKLLIYSPDGILENAIRLVGYETLCYLIADDPDLVQDIFDGVGARLLRYYEILAPHPAVGACIANDDWGFKTQTLLSPGHLRRYVFPWYQRIVREVHQNNKPVILHSCGYFEHIVEDLVAMGFDARHSYEDAILPVEQAYERYHDRFAILGGIDVDFVCRAKPKAVYQRSRAMLERAATRGGYALGTGNSVPEYVPDEGYLAMIWAALA